MKRSKSSKTTPNNVRQPISSTSLLENLREGVIISDISGHILFANDQARSSLGYQDLFDLIGRPLDLVFKLQDNLGQPLPLKKQPAYLAIKSNSIVSIGGEESYSLMNGHGKHFPVVLSATPLFDKGKVTGVMTFFHEYMPRPETLGVDFITLASHQLRTPLTVANLHVDMMLAGHVGPLTNEQRDYLEEISFYNQKMSEVLSEFLMASKIEMNTFKISPRPVNLVEVVEEVLRDLAINFKHKKLTLKKNFSISPVVVIDPEVVRIVLQNLLSNAAKFTPAGGMITISLKKKQDHLILSVADTGHGIPKHEQPRIFERMFRGETSTARKTSGVGFGLYIVKSLLDLCSCKIWFTSKHGEGTTFHIGLPVSAEKKRD